MMAGLEKFVTNKGKPGIIFQGFKYRQIRESKVFKTWRCTVKSCPAYCSTNLAVEFMIDGKFEHKHEEPETRTIQRQQIRQGCKRKAEEEPGERPSKIILSEIGRCDSSELEHKDVKSIRQAIYRARRRTRPTLPKSREETHKALEGYELNSSEDEPMILLNDTQSDIIMFSTKDNLAFLCENNHIMFGDGTFTYCPKFFYQLYTLHVFCNGQYVPCVFFLLPEKSKMCYVNMFKALVDVCSKFGYNLNLTQLHLDFEIATHDAAKTIWPSVIIKGCNFHLGQSWYRKIHSLGLSNDYKDKSSEVGAWLKLFFGLSYLEPNSVEDCFAFDILPEAPAHNQKVMDFSDYVLTTYISENSKFPPSTWANPNIFERRTTNGCESFHKQLSTMFYHSHPNIFDFMDKLKLIQTNSYLRMRASKVQLPMEKKEREKLAQMKDIQDRYESGQTSRSQYLRNMSFKNLPPIL